MPSFTSSRSHPLQLPANALLLPLNCPWAARQCRLLLRLSAARNATGDPSYGPAAYTHLCDRTMGLFLRFMSSQYSRASMFTCRRGGGAQHAPCTSTKRWPCEGGMDAGPWLGEMGEAAAGAAPPTRRVAGLHVEQVVGVRGAASRSTTHPSAQRITISAAQMPRALSSPLEVTPTQGPHLALVHAQLADVRPEEEHVRALHAGVEDLRGAEVLRL